MRVTAISNAFFARRAARLSTWIGLGLAFAAGMWSERTMAAATMCSSDSSTACWRQVTFVNFKDFAVGNGLVCMVGGNVQPSGDAYNNPNNYSQNLGNEDQIECHKPAGVSGISNEPFYPGYGSNPNNPARVPGGVYDHGVWGGTPTGVMALYGPGGDDIAVLNSKQEVYVAPGDSRYFKTGGNYTTFLLDRKNVHATTGAILCLKGLYTQVSPMGNTWWLMALGCQGEPYAASDQTYRGWIPAHTSTFKDTGGGNGWFYGLTSGDRVRRETYRYSKDMPLLPSGTPKALGFRYVISTTSNRIYEAFPTSEAWTFRDVGYPVSEDPGSSLGAIDSGERFRNVPGEFFVWQSFTRVYLYYP